MRAFRDVVDECELVDLGYVGHKFNWRGTGLGGAVLERLDRAFANTSWLELNPATHVQHFRAHSSDHNPILIRPESITPCMIKPFCFEQMWLREEGCGETVKAVWGSSMDISSMPMVSEKIKKCVERLTEWSKHSFGSVQRQLEEKTRELVKAELAATSSFDNNMVRTIQGEIAEIAMSFYESLFTSTQPSAMTAVLEAVEPKVTASMNQELIKDFIREEADFALKHMEPLKAPSSDGSLDDGVYYHCLIFLINQWGTYRLREDEVDRLFVVVEASIIKAIPLSFSNKSDTIFWPKSRDGVYSIKSGYKMLTELESVSEAAASSSSIEEIKGTWNGIWKLQVPNQIRLLM
ncbi:hypothetical protein SO802_002044 [Lithocarpus litseifolius]|uniref:Uncharacterized protein n=1 Tax=Lithocarpus litseifolius TaxID=425828 RepID=A0AAW2E054_9ROSI